MSDQLAAAIHAYALAEVQRRQIQQENRVAMFLAPLEVHERVRVIAMVDACDWSNLQFRVREWPECSWPEVTRMLGGLQRLGLTGKIAGRLYAVPEGRPMEGRVAP